MNMIYECMTGTIDKLRLYTGHACLMHEYMNELIHECMTEYATLNDTNFIAIFEHETG